MGNLRIGSFYFSFVFLNVLFPYSIGSLTDFDSFQSSADIILQDILEKYADSDPDEYWQPYSVVHNENREVVKIENVEKKSISGHYLAWRNAQVGNKNFPVGITKHSIDVYDSSLKKMATMDTIDELRAMTLYTKWNDESSHPEIIVPVATVKSIQVYKVIGGTIIKSGEEWPIQYEIKALKYGVTGSSIKLIIIPVQEGLPIDVYSIDTSGIKTQIWFNQRILAEGKSSVEVFNLGAISNIATAAEKSITVYSFDSTQGQYISSLTIPLMTTSQQLFFYTLAYQHFLASVPKSPNNVEFFSIKTNEFIREDKIGQILAQHIRPVTIDDYIDEPVLITQQETGQIQFLLFAQKEKSFDVGFQCPTKELCTSNADLSEGANFHSNGKITYILPSEGSLKQADIFVISKRVEQTTSPEHLYSRNLLAEYESLKRDVERWERVTTESVGVLANALSRTNPNDVIGSWKINKLSGSEVIMQENGETLFGKRFVDYSFGDRSWMDQDFLITVPEINNKIDELLAITNQAKLTLKDTVPLKSDEFQIIETRQTISGIFSAQFLTSSKIQLNEINRQRDISTFLENIARKGTNLQIESPLTARGSLEIDNLETEVLKKIQVSSIARLAEPNVFKCSFVFSRPFQVHGNVAAPTVGGVPLAQEIIQANDIRGVKFSNALVALKEASISTPINSVLIQKDVFDKLFLKKRSQTISANYFFSDLETLNDVQLKTINGENFHLLVTKVVTPGYNGIIQGEKTILGTVSADSLIVNSLNDISVPDGFVTRDRARVSGLKAFSQLTADTVSLDGKINGLSTSDLVSAVEPANLTTTWILKESVRFLDDLSVTNQVDGVKMDSLRHIDTFDHFKSNYYPNADVVFKQPVHFSSLNIESTINEKSFAEIFGELLLLDAPVTTIKGTTIFRRNVKFDSLQVSSGKINGFDLDEFFTSNTQQNITGTKIFGKSISFSSLYALKLFDSISLSEIFKDAFKISQSRTVSTKLSFENLSCGSKTKVVGKINAFEDFAKEIAVINARDSQVFENSLELETFHAKSLQIANQFQIIDGKTIAGLDLQKWRLKRISLERPTTLSFPFVIVGTATFRDTLIASHINEISLKHLTSEVLRLDRQQQTFTEKVVFTSPIKGDKVQIIFEKSVSGLLLTEIISNAFFIDVSEDIIKSFWSFQSITVKNLIVHGRTCQIDLIKLDMDSLRKGDSDVHVSGAKEFHDDFEVKHALFVNKVNGNDYFTKAFTLHTAQDIENSFLFNKNVFIQSLTPTNVINGISLAELGKIYSFKDGTHILRHDAESDDSISCAELNIVGLIQNRDLKKFLADKAARLASALQISGQKTFVEKVVVEENIQSNQLNEIDLKNFVEMHRTTDEIKFTQPVVFQNIVEASELNIEHKDLTGPTLIDGVSIANLVANAIEMTTKLNEAELKFASCVVVQDIDGVRTTNGIPIDNIVRLNQRQEVGSLRIADAHINGKNVEVGGLINGFDLQREFDNTLWRAIGQTQAVKGRKEFLNSVTIFGNFNCLRQTQEQIVTLQEDAVIKSKTQFTKQIQVNNLDVMGLVNGQSIQEIQKNAMTNGRKEEITGFYTFNGGVTFQQNVEGEGLVNGIDLSSLVPEKLTEAKDAREAISEEIARYESTCHIFDSYHLQASQSPIKLHSLDSHQYIPLRKSVSKMISLKAGKSLHILTFADTCEINKYEWNAKQELFNEEPSKLRLGHVTSWSSTTLNDISILLTAVNQQQSGSCSSVSSGIYVTILTSDGEYSSPFHLASGNYDKVKIVRNENSVGVFILKDGLLNILVTKFDVEVAPELFSRSTQKVELPEHVIDFEATFYQQGAAILCNTKDTVHLFYYPYNKDELMELGRDEFIFSSDARESKMALFVSQNTVYGLIEAGQHAESTLKPDCNIQVFQQHVNGLIKFQRIKTHYTSAISEIFTGTETFVAVLSKYSGVTVHQFLDLGGLTIFNENPIPVTGGTGMITFYVDAWNSTETTPFLAVSTARYLNIIHSNMRGDRAKYFGERNCKIN